MYFCDMETLNINTFRDTRFGWIQTSSIYLSIVRIRKLVMPFDRCFINIIDSIIITVQKEKMVNSEKKCTSIKMRKIIDKRKIQVENKHNDHIRL